MLGLQRCRLGDIGMMYVQKKIQKKLHVASNVNPILAEVSHHRMNTTSMDDYIVALRVRAAHNARLENFYGQVIFRKMKLRAYIGEQRCDAWMFKNIISTFGKDAIFVIGNWNDAGHNVDSKYRQSQVHGYRDSGKRA